MGWQSPSHWLIIALAVVVLFGYKKLPEMSRSVGRSLRIFKTELKGMGQDDAARDSAEIAAPAADQPAVTPPVVNPAGATAPVVSPAIITPPLGNAGAGTPVTPASAPAAEETPEQRTQAQG
jgi:sec-independent protein translocase protein TatA